MIELNLDFCLYELFLSLSSCVMQIFWFVSQLKDLQPVEFVAL